MKIGKENSIKEEEKIEKENMRKQKKNLNGLGKGKRKIRCIKEMIEMKVTNQ